MKSHHVTKNSGDGWKVKKNGASRASGVYDTKAEAEKAGREMSKNQNTELIIHGKNGKIQRRDSHGNDPHPPKG